METPEERITARIAKRREQVKSILAKHPDLANLANALRDTFSAKLIYLQCGSVVYGKLELGVPIGMTRIKARRRKKSA